MPELPEVETVRRGLAGALVGATIARVVQRRADLRFAFPQNFAARLAGRRVEALERRAKYLVAVLDGGEALIMHLGMSGSFRVEDQPIGAFHHPRGAPGPHDHVLFLLSSGATITYNDPRRFGFMDLAGRDNLADYRFFANLGLEPFDPALDGPALRAMLAGKAAPLKAALLDQRLVAGLGNIYVCEALHRARLSPLRAAGTLTAPEARRLVAEIRAVLEEAIAAGGSSLRDHRQTNGALGYFQHGFSAYDREGAGCANKGCGGMITRIVQGGRSTFYCAACQR
ncbi:MAG: bifunctional DNA-formamidopyrimidine glycosylase/DNA-(apurinic or apyrimidinic site) lyase [Hyphomicrobiales bacterium]|nr:bifunctional DNA-formamidopyrimidine glycosylase/DNA-(apurinic or apyrimidinic site) lyase [Hyphomicrobiales bacterium]